MGCCHSKSSRNRNEIYSQNIEDISSEESVETTPLIRKRRRSQHLIKLIKEQNLEQDETGRTCSIPIDR
jgi:hypothetical protein